MRATLLLLAQQLMVPPLLIAWVAFISIILNITVKVTPVITVLQDYLRNLLSISPRIYREVALLPLSSLIFIGAKL